jgi:hypothetical protein
MWAVQADALVGGRRRWAKGEREREVFLEKSPDGEQRPCWWWMVAGVTAFVNWWNIR